MWAKIAILALLAAPALVSARPAPAQAADTQLAGIQLPGQVEGKFAVDARETALTHGYAKQVQKLKELAIDENQLDSIQLVLVDRELPANAAFSDGARHMAAMDGKLRGIVLGLNLPKGELTNGRLLLPLAETPISFSIINSSEAYVIENFKFADGMAEGRVRTTAPEKFPEFNATPDSPKTYAFDVTFKVPVRPAPAVTATLTGEAAKNSEPAKAAIAFEQLLRKKDVAKMRGMIRPGDPMIEILGKPEGKQIMAMMASMSLDAKKRRTAINKVVMMGDNAIVVSRVEGGWDSVQLAKTDAGWKMASPD